MGHVRAERPAVRYSTACGRPPTEHHSLGFFFPLLSDLLRPLDAHPTWESPVRNDIDRSEPGHVTPGVFLERSPVTQGGNAGRGGFFFHECGMRRCFSPTAAAPTLKSGHAPLSLSLSRGHRLIITSLFLCPSHAAPCTYPQCPLSVNGTKGIELDANGTISCIFH